MGGDLRPVGCEVRVRVPATSANLGPGYDSLGLALDLVDDLSVRREEPGTGLRIEVSGEGAGVVPLDENHLVIRALRAGLASVGVEVTDLTLVCRNRIPHGRGLGSSSAAIVGGLTLARALLREGERRLDEQHLLTLATDIEGHPDNVAPALMGGFTIAWMEGETGRAIRCEPHPELAAVAFVPATSLSTELARGLLPDQVPRDDVAFNVARTGLLVHAIIHDPGLLFAATGDRLHQDYRREAYPASWELMHSLRSGGQAAVISGAGPTVLVLAQGSDKLPTISPAGFTRQVLAVRPLGAH
ncbi:MAG: homoserine kinase [Candidatus Nanopelagicales bacterium]|nr:homoserine kinase [Candidatus Nanopelagicales bacterium]